MNKYEEALNELLENAGYLDDGYDNYKAPKVLKEAIEKAQKYDEIFNQKLQKDYVERSPKETLDSLHRLALKNVHHNYWAMVRHQREVIEQYINSLEKENASLKRTNDFMNKDHDRLNEELDILKKYTPTQKVIEEIRDYWDSIDYDLAWQSVVTFYDKEHRFKVIKQKDVLIAREIFQNSVEQLIGMLEGKYANKLCYHPEVLILREKVENLKQENAELIKKDKLMDIIKNNPFQCSSKTYNSKGKLLEARASILLKLDAEEYYMIDEYFNSKKENE